MKEHWFDVGKIRKVEEVVEKKYKSGFGKDTEFDEHRVGIKVVLENGGAFVFPLKTTPDCQVGDNLLIQFERRLK